MDLLSEAKALFPYTQTMRRDFHQHPELGFGEERTSKIVADILQDLGFTVTTGVGRTGVVGMLAGKKESPVVMLRFDMDALPILEENQTDYVSQNKGVMHACGHDSHVATGLTVAKILSAHRAELAGSVKFVFQPAEEGPGNTGFVEGGALAMIKDGVLENPKPDYALAMHVWNEKPVGWWGISNGPCMAGGDYFKVKIIGKGGHGAVPHLAVDPVQTSALIITACQSIVSRSIAPLEAGVVSITHIEGGSAFNVIPPFVEMEGTFRSFTPETRALIIERFEKIVNDISASMNCKAEITITQVTLPVINNKKVAGLMQLLLQSMDSKAEIDSEMRTMGSEDMSYLMANIPGCFIFVGSANHSRGLDFPHHHPRFDIDEDCLPEAAALLANGSLALLSGKLDI